MVVGERIKMVREAKNLSQGDIEKRTGLLRCYLSRVENGHTVPAIETLEKIARAMDIELYQLFYEKSGEPKELRLPAQPAQRKLSGKDAAVACRITTLILRMGDRDKKLLLGMAQKLASR